MPEPTAGPGPRGWRCACDRGTARTPGCASSRRELQESRQLNRRVAELTDLVDRARWCRWPAATSAEVDAVLERYRSLI